MLPPSKPKKTGKNRLVCGGNWVWNRQVKPPRKSAFSRATSAIRSGSGSSTSTTSNRAIPLCTRIHMSLKTLMNHVGAIAVVIYRDYSHWLHDYGLPLPDTRWHDRLFEIKAQAEQGAAPDPARDSGSGSS